MRTSKRVNVFALKWDRHWAKSRAQGALGQPRQA